MQRVADAIETTGVSSTLADRLKSLEQEKHTVQQQITELKPETKAPTLPDIIPGLVERYRGLVADIAQLGRQRLASTDDVKNARKILVALLGQIRVRPRGEVLVAIVTTTAEGLISPPSINSTFVVAGARSPLYNQRPTPVLVDLL